MSATLTPGTTYRVVYRATLYAKTMTVKVLTLTETLVGYTGRPTYIFHGPRGGKVVLGPAEIIESVAL